MRCGCSNRDFGRLAVGVLLWVVYFVGWQGCAVYALGCERL